MNKEAWGACFRSADKCKGRKFKKVEKNYRELMEEIAPFKPKRKARRYSTAGTWVITDMEREL